MFTYDLEDLVKQKLNSMTFDSQDDVPDDFRRQIFTKERQKNEPYQSKSAKSAISLMPITTNNHFPDHPQCSVPRPLTDHDKGLSLIEVTGPPKILSPLGCRVREYSTWQKSGVEDPAYKADVDKACKTTLENYCGPQQIYNEQDVTFLVERGVRIGMAKRFIRAILVRAKCRRYEG